MVFCYMEHPVYPGYPVSDVRNIQNVLNYPGIATTLPNIPKGFRAHVSANLLKIFFEKLETLSCGILPKFKDVSECSGRFRISVPKTFNDFSPYREFCSVLEISPSKGKTFPYVNCFPILRIPGYPQYPECRKCFKCP